MLAVGGGGGRACPLASIPGWRAGVDGRERRNLIGDRFTTGRFQQRTRIHAGMTCRRGVFSRHRGDGVPDGTDGVT